MLGERFQIAAQEGSTTAEPRGLPELRKQTWEPKEAKVVEAPRVEYERGASCTERRHKDIERVPLRLQLSTSVCVGRSY